MISRHYPLPQLHKCTTDLCAWVTSRFHQILFSGFFSLWKLEDFLYISAPLLAIHVEGRKHRVYYVYFFYTYRNKLRNFMPRPKMKGFWQNFSFCIHIDPSTAQREAFWHYTCCLRHQQFKNGSKLGCCLAHSESDCMLYGRSRVSIPAYGHRSGGDPSSQLQYYCRADIDNCDVSY